MGVFDWIAQHSDLLQNLGIIVGFVFTAHSVRKESEARKISNMVSVAQHHYAIWKQLYERPELSRIMDRGADLGTKPLTNEELLFVTSLIQHLDMVRRMIKAKMFVKLEGLQTDIKEFFSLPIPKAVWETMKPFQDKAFIRFVGKILRAQDSGYSARIRIFFTRLSTKISRSV